MKILSLLPIALTFSLSSGSFFSETANAQEYNRQCVQGTSSCAYNDYPKDNPNLYLRTTPQASQHPVNRADNVCSDSNSSTCRQLTPQIETRQESNTFQQLRERQIDTVENKSL